MATILHAVTLGSTGKVHKDSTGRKTLERHPTLGDDVDGADAVS